MRDRLALLDRALIARRKAVTPSPPPVAPARPNPRVVPESVPVATVARTQPEPVAAAPAPIIVTFEPTATAAPQVSVRREPLRPLHRINRGLAALWWLFADGVLLGLAALLRGLRPVRTMTVGAPLACVLVGVGISLWWGSWAYAIIGALAAACFVWFGREQSPGP